ncbi:MAG: nicotinate phosphoribosyltransferase [Desulfobacteraceae bacterium]|nr:nicotinate phosphoribosyltransferase [Desulfobacteraceae bacterium]
MKIWEQYVPELVTDLYELTMAECYLREGMSGEAAFSLFIRDYPAERSYFVAAGIEHLLEVLPDLRFGPEALDYLASLGKFSREFIDYLRDFRFTGTVRAIPEGRIFFANEPLVEVIAPIIEAQIVETLVLNVMQLETMLASKAARVCHAAGGRGLIDFGMRRAHGVDASVKAARASYLTGFLGTSNLLAGRIYGIPVFGTMAHSYVSSFTNESEAFDAFSRVFPGNTVLLIDTYDTIAGARKAIEMGRAMRNRGERLVAVRLDSGDLTALSKEVRQILDAEGFSEVQIMASGNLDEFKIEDLIREGAAIDLYAVGTRMVVSADAPYLDISYKLVEYEGKPVVKLSSGKKTWVGQKQIYRHYDADGKMDYDILCLMRASGSGGEPLLRTVVEGGCRTCSPEPLEKIRERFAEEWSRLPESLRAIRPRERYRVEICDSLQRLDLETVRQKRREAGI